MGILDKFKTPKSNELKNGSEFAPKYSTTGAIPKSELASEFSPLHAGTKGEEGYSLNGTDLNGVTKLYNEYDDGVVNALPTPTEYENFPDPTGTFKPQYNSGKKYEDNHPEKPTTNVPGPAVGS
jgi:hypothetical protein